MRLAKGWIWALIFGVALLALIGWRVATNKQQGGAMTKDASSSRKRPATVDVATAKSADILNTVDLVGDIESPQSVDLSPKVTGRIEMLQVREGDKVKAGQVLVQIDPSDLNQQILQMQAAVAEAKSKLAQAQLTQGSTNVGVLSQVQQQEAGVRSAKADYNQTQENYSAQVQSAQSDVADNAAKLNAANVQVKNAQAFLAQQQSNLNNANTKLQRMQTLFSQGAISQQQRDDAQTTVEVQQQAVNVADGQVSAAQAAVTSAQASLSSSKDQLSIVKKKGLADIAAAKAKLEQAQSILNVAVANKSQAPAYQANIDALQSAVNVAQAQYEAAKVHLGDTILKSPMNGVVTARAADPGDMTSPGKSLLTVQSLDWVYANSSVPIDDVGVIHEGMNAQVTVDALPGQIFAGPITNLNPSADTQSRQFGIRVRLDNPLKQLKPGMYARVAIITQNVHADVAVPIEAIDKDDSGMQSVTVVDSDGIAHVTQVTTGATDGKITQIKRGVKAGDQVVTLSYSPVKDGQQVMVPGADKDSGESGDASGSSGKSAGGSGKRHKKS